MIKSDVKKRILISGAVIAVALIAFLVALYFLLPPKETAKADNEYYPANYDENIYLNQAYMSFQRDLIYSVGGVDQLFSYEKDLDSAELECRFFLEYFHTVIEGDYEGYRKFFVDGFFEEDPKFTMQMIYDPYVQYHSTSTDEVNGKEITLVNFQVRYRIFKNNKTFRPEVSSNTLVPQIYQLIKGEDGSYRIFRILEIEVEE